MTWLTITHTCMPVTVHVQIVQRWENIQQSHIYCGPMEIFQCQWKPYHIQREHCVTSPMKSTSKSTATTYFLIPVCKRTMTTSDICRRRACVLNRQGNAHGGRCEELVNWRLIWHRDITQFTPGRQVDSVDLESSFFSVRVEWWTDVLHHPSHTYT